MLKGEYCRRRIQQQTSTLPFQVLINIWWRKGVRAVWWGTKYGGNRKHRRNARGEDSLHDTVRGLLYQQKSASRSPQQWLNRIWPSNTISFASNFMYMSFVVASSSCFLAERYEHCLLIDKKNDPGFRDQGPEEMSLHLLLGAQDQWLGAEQDHRNILWQLSKEGH